MTAVERAGALRNATDLLESLLRLKDRASTKHFDALRTHKDLYVLLGECLDFAVSCRGSQRLVELYETIKSAGREAGFARWVLDTSDEYTLTCRFVFGTPENTKRANSSRYAVAIREAARRGIAGCDFVEFVQENGGLNALIHDRPTRRAIAKTKTLRLDQQITVPKVGEFSLTLSRKPDGSFAVHQGPSPAS